jgi:hypothetical protein
MEKTPFNSIRKNIISISMFFFSPDGSEKPAAYKLFFLDRKERSGEAPFMA